MLNNCFSPDELFKIQNITHVGPLAVLNKEVHLGMTAMVKNSRQFDMSRGLSDQEKLSKAQQAAANQIHYGRAMHGGPDTFNFNIGNDEVNTISKHKKVGARATASVSGKTFAGDVYSMAGDTTLPSYQNEAEESDSVASSVETVDEQNAIETEESNSHQTPSNQATQLNNTVIDLSGMDKGKTVNDFEIDDEVMSLHLGKEWGGYQCFRQQDWL